MGRPLRWDSGKVRYMTDAILMFIFLACLESLFMEVYKRRLRGNGETTNASRYELWAIGALVAFLFAFAMKAGNDLGMGYWALIPYTCGMYALQFFLSMKIVKSILKRFIPKE